MKTNKETMPKNAFLYISSNYVSKQLESGRVNVEILLVCGG